MALQDWVAKDLRWKLFSLALAIVIWVTIHFRNETVTSSNFVGSWTTRTFHDLPVLVVSAGADVRDFKVDPGTVEVTVGGRREIIEALREKEIHVMADLTDFEAARDLRKRVDVSGPPGVTFVRVTPPEVDVVLPPKRAENP